ncbi:hypothetical protein GCM10009782_40130 [Glycomyces algeriensis]
MEWASVHRCSGSPLTPIRAQSSASRARAAARSPFWPSMTARPMASMTGSGAADAWIMPRSSAMGATFALRTAPFHLPSLFRRKVIAI